MKRRTFLGTGAAAGLLSTGGCLSRLGIGGDAEDVGTDHNDHEEDEDSESETGDHDEQVDDDPEDDSTNDTDEMAEDDDDDEAQEDDEDEDDPEDQLTPDEEDIEPDRDEYERHEEREYDERSEDDVEVTAEAHDDGTVVTVQGRVENVSEEPIDAVDLDSSLYGPGDEYLGATRTSVQEVAPGESKSFDSSTEAGDVVGEIEYIDMAVRVYEFDKD